MTDSLESLQLETGSEKIDQAFCLALHHLEANIVSHYSTFFKDSRPILLPGLDYDTPWTRDAAINVWNGTSFFLPHISKNTLLSQLTELKEPLIKGQYWDRIIWCCGAWDYYLITGDREFLTMAMQAVANTLEILEKEEFNADLGLFRGPAVYGDGVAAYPDTFADTEGDDCILAWRKNHVDEGSAIGGGIPMHTLSTNSLYYQVYGVLEKMALQLKSAPNRNWWLKRDGLRQAINYHFWDSNRGYYRYLVSPLGNCESWETLGHAFAILFGIANPFQKESIFKKAPVTLAGIPCLWPNFQRYHQDRKNYGRHSGTVWPMIQGFWGEALAMSARKEELAFELFRLVQSALRDEQFSEIYHPLTGERYGGIQERDGAVVQWESRRCQTWSATAFLRMILFGIIGARLEPQGIFFNPLLPESIKVLRLKNLHYQKEKLNIEIFTFEEGVNKVVINGKESPDLFYPSHH